MKEKIRIFLVHLLFFILSIWPLGVGLGMFFAIPYCKIEDCSGYNDNWILPFWVLGVFLLNVLFYFYYKEKYNKKSHIYK